MERLWSTSHKMKYQSTFPEKTSMDSIFPVFRISGGDFSGENFWTNSEVSKYAFQPERIYHLGVSYNGGAQLKMIILGCFGGTII